jgi:hypothetical protein
VRCTRARELPSSLSGCGQLLRLDVAGNCITALDARLLSGVTALQDLDASWNCISGELPEEVGALCALRTLRLQVHVWPGWFGCLKFLSLGRGAGGRRFASAPPFAPCLQRRLRASAVVAAPGPSGRRMHGIAEMTILLMAAKWHAKYPIFHVEKDQAYPTDRIVTPFRSDQARGCCVRAASTRTQ